jgi:hypothetical protein
LDDWRKITKSSAVTVCFQLRRTSVTSITQFTLTHSKPTNRRRNNSQGVSKHVPARERRDYTISRTELKHVIFQTNFRRVCTNLKLFRELILIYLLIYLFICNLFNNDVSQRCTNPGCQVTVVTSLYGGT